MQTKIIESQESVHEEKEQQQTSCEICNMGSEQIKCIITHLLLQFKNAKVEETNQNIYDCGGFTKLLKLIFHSKCKNFRDTMKCPHTRAQSYFLQNLDVNISQLNKVSNKKITSLAKYNFHSDVISLQVKSFHRHFSGVESKKQNRKMKRKQVSPQKTARTGITQKRNMQQKQKSSQNKQPDLEPIVKQQAEYAHSQMKQPGQFVDYHQMGGSFHYHPIRFDNQFSQIMNNMLMINYGFHPVNQP